MNKYKVYPTRMILLFLSSLLNVSLMILRPPTIGASAPLAARAYSPAEHLWVDAARGNDQNPGLASSTALRSVQKAAELAAPGTTVHVLPGVYRETIRPSRDGSATAPITYVAEGGLGTAILRGSEPSSSLNWTQLSNNSIGLPAGVAPQKIYYADLTQWRLSSAPRFVVQLDDRGEVVQRLPMAREPDWQIVRDWKYSEYWWTADGGSSVPSCDPTSSDLCDRASWSTTQLIDRTHDTLPAGVEAGNLTTLGNLSGATLAVLDTRQGHYSYRRTIASHDIAGGRITVSKPCTYGSSGDALGWGSKYYVEGLPALLDQPGEWWYDTNSKRLYLWPLQDRSPSGQNIEISRRDTGVDWSGVSNHILDGITVEFYNEYAVYQSNTYRQKSHNNTIRNSTLRYANWGLWVTQTVQASEPAENITDGFSLLDSEIAHMDTRALKLASWWDNNAAADSFVRSPVRNTTIRGNEFHHLGFRSDQDHAQGLELRYADRLRFQDNHVHHTAHHGIQFHYSVIQSGDSYSFDPTEIKTGEILIANNVIERACQLTTECAALKIWGNEPDNHVYRDVLVFGNVFRDTFGWAYVAEKRNMWAGETSSDAGGMGGFGLDIDMASGVHIYRNIAYNNANIGFRFAGTWRDGDIVCYNNVLANSIFGVRFSGQQEDTHPSANTQIANNILSNNEAYGIVMSVQSEIDNTIVMDHNLYYNNGWRSRESGGHYSPGAMAIFRKTQSNTYLPTLSDVHSRTPWETHGIEGTPSFWSYDPSDHNLHDGSWPSFLLTSRSALALDQGADLPRSLTDLLSRFGIGDARWGSAYDIGRYEWSGDNLSYIFMPLILQD